MYKLVLCPFLPLLLPIGRLMLLLILYFLADIPRAPNKFTRQTPYTGTINAFMEISSKEGWKALYKGLAAALYTVCVKNIKTSGKSKTFTRKILGIGNTAV